MAGLKPKRRFHALADRMVDLAVGRRTHAILQGLLVSQHWPATRLRSLQQKKATRLLEHAREHTSFYRDRAMTSGGARSFGETPIIERNDICQHARRMRRPHGPARPMLCSSRGTTGDGVSFFWDRCRQAYDRANRFRAHGWFGFDHGDRELHLWPVDPPVTRPAQLRDWLRRIRDRAVGDLLIDARRVLNCDWRGVIDEWHAFDPARMTAYPSVLCELIRHADEQTISLGNPSLRQIFLTGEPAFDWQRNLITQRLGVPTATMYGVQEVGAMAFECPRGAWHVCAESVDVELVTNGRAATGGELAEIVATGLESRAMPVIRYCTGDIVRNELARCDCDVTLPTMPPVLGRAGDFLVDSDGAWIEPQRVSRRLGRLLGEGRFCIRQREDRSIDLLVDSPVSTTGVLPIIEDLLGERIRLTEHRVASLPRTASLKLRYCSSALSAAGLARGEPLSETAARCSTGLSRGRARRHAIRLPGRACTRPAVRASAAGGVVRHGGEPTCAGSIQTRRS